MCLFQLFFVSVFYFVGDVWKFDVKGNQMFLEEGMDIDELEGVKIFLIVFVSLLFGDGSCIVLFFSLEVILYFDEDIGILQIVLCVGQVEFYVLKRKSDYDCFQVLILVGVLGVCGIYFCVCIEDGQVLIEVFDGCVVVNCELISDDLLFNGRCLVCKVVQVELDEDVLVDVCCGLKVKLQGKLMLVDLLFVL